MTIIHSITYEEDGEALHEYIGPFDDKPEAQAFVQQEGLDTHEASIEYETLIEPMDYE